MNTNIKIIDENNARYFGYLISGNENIRYVCVSPYGKFSPESYATLDEAIEAINNDICVAQGYDNDNCNICPLHAAGLCS